MLVANAQDGEHGAAGLEGRAVNKLAVTLAAHHIQHLLAQMGVDGVAAHNQVAEERETQVIHALKLIFDIGPVLRTSKWR